MLYGIQYAYIVFVNIALDGFRPMHGMLYSTFMVIELKKGIPPETGDVLPVLICAAQQLRRSWWTGRSGCPGSGGPRTVACQPLLAPLSSPYGSDLNSPQVLGSASGRRGVVRVRVRVRGARRATWQAPVAI